MGDLIAMSRSKTRPACQLESGHSAEILFFTGVRYYRLAETVDLPVTVVAKLDVKRRRSPEKRLTAKLKREQRREALA